MNYFEAEVAASAQALDLFYVKIAVPQKGGLKLKTSPFDAVIFAQGRAIVFEMKSQALHGSFPLGNIEEHQLEGLARAAREGLPAYLLFNMRRKPVRKGRPKSKNQAWALPFENYIDLITSLPLWRGKPRRSIPLEFFDDARYFIELPRIRVEDSYKGKMVPTWDLRRLL